jgi:hypothetical protein
MPTPSPTKSPKSIKKSPKQICKQATELNGGPLGEITNYDMDFFAVSTVWYNKWSKHLEGGLSPGPLDNSSLLDKDLLLPLSKYNVFGDCVSMTLESPRDYLLWSRPVADYFHAVYGGDKPYEVKRDFGGYMTGNIYSERIVSLERHHKFQEEVAGRSGEEAVWDPTSTPKGHYTFIYNGTKRYVRPIEPVKNSTCWLCWEMPKKLAECQGDRITWSPVWDIESGDIELKQFALEKMEDFKFSEPNIRVIDSPIGYDNTFLVEINKSSRPTQKTWSLTRVPQYETTTYDKEVFMIEPVEIGQEEWHELKQAREEIAQLKWDLRKLKEHQSRDFGCWKATV